MQCEICGKESIFEVCQDCQTNNQTLLTIIKSLKEKIKNLAQELAAEQAERVKNEKTRT